jgi:hypothetical protein
MKPQDYQAMEKAASHGGIVLPIRPSGRNQPKSGLSIARRAKKATTNVDLA